MSSALGRSGSWVLAGLVLACGGEATSPSPPAGEEAEAPAMAPAAPTPGDPLLQRAREGIRDGALAAEDEEAVLGSSDPAHARARRILLAMQQPLADDVADDEGPAADEPTPLVPPAVGDTPAPIEREATDAPRTEPASPRPSPPRSGSSRVGKLSLSRTSRGATLTIKGSAKLVVGVANQPSSGIVRIIVEKAEAASSVLTARPSVTGARVTGVRQGRDTLQVTVRLDPGWSLGSVSPFAGGAKVHLVAPR